MTLLVKSPNMEMMIDDNSLEEIPIENEQWLQDMKSPDSNFNTLAAPAFEVFSVSIYPNSFSDRKTCEVYGNISIEDENGTCYDLYRREPDNADIVSSDDNTLLINMPAECTLSDKLSRMRMSLKDKSDDAVIVEQVFGLDFVTKDHDYNRLRTQEVHGVGGSASVSYCALQTAVLVLVKIELIKKVESCAGFPPIDVFGRIIARNGNTYGKTLPGIELFKKQPNQFTPAESQVSIELSRDLMAIPAYSFLRIEVDLLDSLTSCPIVNGKADFLTRNRHRFHEDIHGKNFLVRVNVEWFHPYFMEKQIEQQFKRRKIHDGQLPRPSLSIGSEPFLRKHKAMGFSLVEVFTVMIGHSSRSDVNLCGTFLIRDCNLMHHHVFDRDEKNPETLSGNKKTISIAGLRECVDGPEGLLMKLDLKDVQGRVIIAGIISWNLSSIKSPISWYDKRVCAVFRGIHGYAAVHYTMFSRAVQAFVKVSFVSNETPDVSHRVHGNITARYSNQDYSTDYNRAYYQSILFDEPPERASELRSGCTMRLLKSVVAVPSNASLIVDVDLYASSLLNGIPGEHFKDVAEFKIDPDASVCPAALHGKNYRIDVSVEWSKMFKLYT